MSQMLHEIMLQRKQLQRWVKLGPWYAMFPLEFAQASIEQHTKPGQAVLDPFMGRGTTLAAAKMLERHAAGVEINPVAWVYAKVKTEPCDKLLLLERLEEVNRLSKGTKLQQMPEFYKWCFCDEVLRFLLIARSELKWKDDHVDRTLMAIILVDLHGNVEDSLSNQMRQTKSMAPAYSINWWKAKDMHPAEKDAYAILRRKIEWRYKHGLFSNKSKIMALNGDSTSILKETAEIGPFHLLLTSPPYYGIINYNYDQWLRRWMLGGPELPKYSAGKYQDRYDNKIQYQELLSKVFGESAKLMHERAHVVVRTDARVFTLESTIKALEEAFPGKSIKKVKRPVLGKTQTRLYGDQSKKPGEVDLILKPKPRQRTSQVKSRFE
ncbi:DNA methyltransferase [Deinococcus frigens]|uniref:DNA methyltransferase n=1 Tax=Deinococcus frigens TaxID=249403 RepID=UPI000A05EDE9|nr:DNA methyltransferase [Deinococcus frigens]